MREKTIEQKLVSATKERGGICPKWVAPGFDGMPDRIVFLPGRHFGLVEVKAPGQVPRPLQVSRHRLLERLGFRVYVVDDPEQIGVARLWRQGQESGTVVVQHIITADTIDERIMKALSHKVNSNYEK